MEKPSFQGVCQEVQLWIFNYLGSKDLACTSLVSKEWQAISSDQSLWRSLFSRDFPQCHLPGDRDARRAYRSRNILYLKSETSVYPSHILGKVKRIGERKVPFVEEQVILSISSEPVLMNQNSRIFKIELYDFKTDRVIYKNLEINDFKYEENGFNTPSILLIGGNLYVGDLTGNIQVLDLNGKNVTTVPKTAGARASQLLKTPIFAMSTAIAYGQKLFSNGDKKNLGSAITCLAYDKEEGKFYSGSRDGTIKVWEAKSGEGLQLQMTFKAHLGAITHLVCEERRLYSASKTDGVIKHWNLTEKGPVLLKSFIGFNQQLNRSCCHFENGKFFTTLGPEGPLGMADLETDGSLKNIGDGVRDITALTSAEGNLVSASRDGTIAIWGIENEFRRILTLGGADAFSGNKVYTLSYLGDTGELRVKYHDRIEIWDFNDIHTEQDLSSWGKAMNLIGILPEHVKL